MVYVCFVLVLLGIAIGWVIRWCMLQKDSYSGGSIVVCRIRVMMGNTNANGPDRLIGFFYVCGV